MLKREHETCFSDGLFRKNCYENVSKIYYFRYITLYFTSYNIQKHSTTLQILKLHNKQIYTYPLSFILLMSGKNLCLY